MYLYIKYICGSSTEFPDTGTARMGEHMEIIISNNANKPIYEQITSQIKAMIMSGQLQAGDAIPSMRALAKSIHVSVITVQKAYEDLQRDGFIETTVGRGSFVSARDSSSDLQGILPGRTAAHRRGASAGRSRNRAHQSYLPCQAGGAAGHVL